MSEDLDDLFGWGEKHRAATFATPPEPKPKWGNEYVRSTDGTESHQAAEDIDAENDRQECFRLISAMILGGEWYVTYKTFENEYLPGLGFSKVRSGSLRKRISDMVIRDENPFPEGLWLLCKTGEQYDRSAILTFTERGRLVLDDPGLMVGVWGQKGKRKKRSPKSSEKQ